MVEMQVYGLAVDKDSESPILVLKDDKSGIMLPIWIGAMEAMSISLVLNEVEFPRPMTHDLLLDSIHMLDGEVVSVEILKVDQGTFYSEILISHKETIKRLDSRPSDAVAVALRSGAPVLVSPEVLEQAGTHDPEDESAAKSDDWSEEFENLSPDDFKYKM
ncbi:bifunctional nuclease family protein [Maridesulfovibrio bastinii]|uniref:bifunctional nuclease family protein n=1 Tax=Maridesulfovibrio bastinii TaxID=47157 RepID=UPI00047F20C5|nr:bifunctional nuclease family protein [Maridesulfovibrio bastinii]